MAGAAIEPMQLQFLGESGRPDQPPECRAAHLPDFLETHVIADTMCHGLYHVRGHFEPPQNLLRHPRAFFGVIVEANALAAIRLVRELCRWWFTDVVQ